MEKNIGFECAGIICDNKTCDYEDKTVYASDYKDWLNKPCPKCGENLLTEDDYNRFSKLMNFVNLINKIKLPKWMKKGEKQSVIIGTHKEYSIKEPEDNN